MLFVTILLPILCATTTVRSAHYSNVGTCLFSNKQNDSRCWTSTELAKLRARQIFEQIIPPQPALEKISSRYVRNTINYYRRALSEVTKDENRESREILRDALADTIGAHLKVKTLPAVRLAYYAGYIRYKEAKRLHDFHDELKCMLNTQGLGWKRPTRSSEWSNLTVEKLMIDSGRIFRPCRLLNVQNDSKSCFHLPEPQLDDNEKPSAIALPFKNLKLVSLTSPMSENILIKYYLSAARCILHSSPPNCRHSDFVNFNNEMWHWMKRDVAPHLIDETLYSAFGGVLRIAAAVQSYGKDLKRRYLEYTMPPRETLNEYRHNLWDKLTQPSITVDSQWDAKFYILVVIVAAIAICGLQICYNYMFGDAFGCQCYGYGYKTKQQKQREKNHKHVYGNDSTAITSVITAQYPQLESERKPSSVRSSPTRKSISTRSTKTQKVFDLNENTEKIMAIAMSDFVKRGSATSQPSVNSGEETESPSPTVRSHSPPKLETPISQLKISRTSVSKARGFAPETASLITSSEVTFKQATSTTGSQSSSTMSASSRSSKSQSRLSKSSRDMAWARRMLSRKSLKSVKKDRSKSGTEDFTYTSTTPRSRR